MRRLDRSLGDEPSQIRTQRALETRFVMPFPYLRDCVFLFAIFSLLYFFKLSAFTIAIDDEMAAVRDSADVWLLQGRWGVYVLERFIVTQQVVPFFPFFVFGCCLTMSYRILLSAFGVTRATISHYLAFVLYAGFPIWMYAIAFFSNTIAFGLGQLTVVWAFAIACPLIESARYRVRAIAPACCVLAVSISFYQSFALEFCALGAAYLVTQLLAADDGWRLFVRRMAMLVVIAFLSMLLYEIVNLLTLTVMHMQERYVANFLNLGALRYQPLTVIAKVFGNIAATYGGGASVFGAQLYSFTIVVACGLLSLSLRLDTHAKALKVFIALFAMICAPFALHGLSGGNLPARTLVAVPVVMWFLGMLALSSDRRWLARLSLVALLAASLQIVYALNLMQTANEFARKHDELLAGAVYARIAEVLPVATGAQPFLVDFYGGQNFDSVFPRSEHATQGYSFFEWDGGNIFRIAAYMRLLGYPQLRIPDLATRRANDAEFQRMPVWPAPGSVRWANGMALVRLGEAPGFR